MADSDRIFTTPEFQKRYESVRISLMTPKVALIPEQFFNPMDIRQTLADVVELEDSDQVEVHTDARSTAPC